MQGCDEYYGFCQLRHAPTLGFRERRAARVRRRHYQNYDQEVDRDGYLQKTGAL